MHIYAHTQTHVPVPTCGHASSCVTFTNRGWSRCDYAFAWNCINDASRFDAVSQTDYPALNPVLNPTCHTKASCVPSYQCKHINATLFTVITSQVKEGHIYFESALRSYSMSRWKQAGLEKGQKLSEGIHSWKRESIIIIC